MGRLTLARAAAGALLAAVAAVAAVSTVSTVAARADAAEQGAERSTQPGGPPAPRIVAANDSLRGNYLAVLGGCNDCHTPGWNESGGRTPQADRLTGSPVGFRGPWGTTYPANLRLAVASMREDAWVANLATANHGTGRPPMPWMNAAQTNPQDLRALYRYLRALGPKGERMPLGVAPGVEPTTAYILMVPQQPKAASAGGR